MSVQHGRASRRAVGVAALGAVGLATALVASAVGCGDARVVRAGDPVDVAVYARLTGTRPRLRFPFTWPREAEDGWGAVRDGQAGSSYKPPADARAVLVFDWLPVFGRPIPVTTVTMRAGGAALTAVGLRVGPSCPAADTPLPWPDPTLPIAVNATIGCLKLDFTAGADSAVESVRIEGRAPDPYPMAPADTAPGVSRRDSGVIEGFYGIPWSPDEATRMIARVAGFGMGAYVYGPKNDPLHRDLWRDAYAAEQLAVFGALARAARERDVRFYFAISPFTNWRSDSEDYPVLIDKLRTVARAGVTDFALFADDIEFALGGEDKIDGPMGAAHAAIANRLLADLRATAAVPDTVHLLFVGAVYSDERRAWPKGDEYLGACAALDPEIGFLWTGPKTSNVELRASDFDAVSRVLGRKPILWDNFWANDGGDGFQARLQIGALSGRARDLMNGLAGIMHNPSIQGSLARWALGTQAAWFDNPAVTAPDAYAYSAAAEFPSPGLDAVGRSAEANRAVMIELMTTLGGTLGGAGTDFAYDGAAAAFIAAPDAPRARALALEAARLYTLASRAYHAGFTAETFDELVWPLEKVTSEAERVLVSFLRAAAACAPGGPTADVSALDARLRELDRAAPTFRFAWGAGNGDGLQAAITGAPCAAVFADVRELDGACPGAPLLSEAGDGFGTGVRPNGAGRPALSPPYGGTFAVAAVGEGSLAFGRVDCR